MGPGEATPAFGRVWAAFVLLQKERLRGPVFYKGWQLSPRAKPAAVSPASEDKNRYSGPHDGRGGPRKNTGISVGPRGLPPGRKGTQERDPHSTCHAAASQPGTLTGRGDVPTAEPPSRRRNTFPVR